MAKPKSNDKPVTIGRTMPYIRKTSQREYALHLLSLSEEGQVLLDEEVRRDIPVIILPKFKDLIRLQEFEKPPQDGKQ